MTYENSGNKVINTKTGKDVCICTTIQSAEIIARLLNNYHNVSGVNLP